MSRPAPPWIVPVALGAAGLLLAGVLPGPAGSDPDLWVWAGLNLLAGQPSMVPPLLPGLLALVHLLGAAPFDAARLAVTLAAPFLAPLTWALARELGASPRAALVAGLLPLLTGCTAAFYAQVMPELPAAVAFTLLALATVRFVRAPTDRGLVLLAVAAAAAVVAREHGIVLAGGAALGAGLAPGDPRTRAGRLAAVVGAVVVIGPVLGGTLALPWAQPWFTRLGEMGAPADVARTVPNPGPLDRPAWALGIIPEGLVWVALGVAAAAGRDRRALLVPMLLPAFGALATWSQPRHVAVLLPIAFAAWAARPGGGWRWLGALAIAFGLARAPFHLGRLRVEAGHLEELRVFGEALCEVAAPTDLAWGEPSAFLFCPLRWHEVDGTPTDWKVWAVGRPPPRAGWMEAPLGVGVFDVRRVDPRRSGDRRPCAASAPVPTSPWFSSPPATARLDPPCTEPLPAADGGPTRVAPTRVRPRGSAGR